MSVLIVDLIQKGGREMPQKIETPQQADDIQLILWQIKDDAFRLLSKKGNFQHFVELICQQVNTELRDLGYDPDFIVKTSTRGNQ